jgi:hypothetical protein
MHEEMQDADVHAQLHTDQALHLWAMRGAANA